MWLGGGKPGRWTDEDLLLLAALTAYEDGLCQGCGQPKDRAWAEDAPGYYERDSLVCKGCAALHGEHHDKPEPGRKEFVVFEAPPA